MSNIKSNSATPAADQLKARATASKPTVQSQPDPKPTPKSTTKLKSPKVTARVKSFFKKPNLDFRTTMCVLVGIALVASLTSLGFNIVNFFRGDDPITFNYGGTNGNSIEFQEGSIADVANQVAPGVVSIVTEVRSTNFFGQSSTGSAAGTGMIVTSDGYVLTNKHVIEDANSVQIILDDGTTYDDVKLVGTDPLNDVAFLKINNVSNLPTVTLGDSKTVTAGQQVIAIGNALGQFQNTITSGIVSATGRSITAASSDYSSAETLTDMIQTDAAINSGNSGGPLVNAAGEVIGINTAVADADGIGFAIPISSVKGMLKSIINQGKADRAYLGLYYINITPAVATAYDLPVSTGAYVYSSAQYSAVISGGPAAKAGVKEKDIITAINGVKVGQNGSVSSLIGEYAPGDTVQLQILRGDREIALNVTLGSYNELNN